MSFPRYLRIRYRVSSRQCSPLACPVVRPTQKRCKKIDVRMHISSAAIAINQYGRANCSIHHIAVLQTTAFSHHVLQRYGCYSPSARLVSFPFSPPAEFLLSLCLCQTYCGLCNTTRFLAYKASLLLLYRSPTFLLKIINKKLELSPFQSTVASS